VSKHCTPQQLGTHLGLTVSQRPFNILFKLSQSEQATEVDYKLTNLSQADQEHTRRVQLRPVHPISHACNESYRYGDYDYGAKCSCKACQNSCELYSEFFIAPKRMFKIGPVDGVGVIMTLAFLVFAGIFIRMLFYFGLLKSESSRRRKNAKQIKMNGNCQPLDADIDQAEINKTSPETSPRSSCFSCFNKEIKSPPGSAAQSLLTQSANLPPSLQNPPKLKLNDSDQIEQQQIADGTDRLATEVIIKRSKRQRMANHLQKIKFLDRMRLAGDQLERFFVERFTRLGKFCATYPFLVLSIGLAFCGLMCLGYFNFTVEKDPVKLWSAETSIARRNKKYFDDNFK
jgi:hypothetical protein